MRQLTAVLALCAALVLLPLSGTAAAADCPPVPGLGPLVEAGTVLLLGEVHGTEQAPGFVATVACHGVAAGLPVVVGLEIPVAERERVAAFLASDGGAEAETALLAGPLWQAEVQYGVSSRAMADLLDALRARRAAGDAVEVVPYDPGQVPGRDRGMAENLAAALADRPDVFAVVLSGNLHTRLTAGTPFDPKAEPMGHLLARTLDGRRVVSLNMAHQGGAAWVCFGSAPEDCGVKELSGRAERAAGVELDEDAAGAPFSGRYFTGPITASPPAAGGGD